MHRSRVLHSFLLLILIFSLNGSINTTIAQNDANSGQDAPDDVGSAIPVNFETNYTGTIGNSYQNQVSAADDYDEYRVQVANTGNLSAIFNITSTSSSLTTVSLLRNGLTAAIESFFQYETPFRFVVPVPSSATYTLQINSFSSNVTYEFSLHFDSGPIPQQMDAGTNGDSAFPNPKSVVLDTLYTGSMGNNRIDSTGLLDRDDYYRVSLPSSGYLTVNITEVSGDSINNMFIFMETPNFDTITSGFVALYTSNYVGSASIATAGDYIMHFTAFEWNATYTFQLSFQAATLPSQNDTGANGDATSSYLISPVVGVNTTVSGTVGDGLLEVDNNGRDYYDAYGLGNLPYGNLTLNISFIESIDSYPSVNLSFLDTTGYPTITLSASVNTPYEEYSLIVDPGVHYIVASSLDYNVSYTAGISFVQLPPPPTTRSQSDTSTTHPQSSISSATDNISVSSSNTDQPSSNLQTPFPILAYSVTFFVLIIFRFKRKSTL